MFQQNQLMDLLHKERLRTESLLERLEQRKKQLPQGSLVYKNGSYYRAVIEKGKRRQLIIPKDFPDYDEFIGDLKEARYISKAIPLLRKNAACCRQAEQRLRIYDPYQVRAELPDYYRDFDPRRLLLEGDLSPEQWDSQNYEQNTIFPEERRHFSEGGVAVRSKAEAEIATKLEQYGLTFRYEPILCLKNYRVSPDFEILHPVERRILIWEHFGKMDDPGYAAEAMKKLNRYARNGYRLGDNLIMTWEAKHMPLSFSHINWTIRHYFGMEE